MKSWLAVIGIGFIVAGVPTMAQGGPGREVAEHRAGFAYPRAYRDKTVDVYFGTRVAAPYQWMENLQNPELKHWVAAENQLTDAHLAKIKLREVLYRRLERLWDYAKEGSPIQAGGKLFFSRNPGLENQATVYVQDGINAKPRVLFNPNRISPNGNIALAGYQPSPDGKYLAYELSLGGSDWQTIHVLDVATGKTLPRVVRWVKFANISWTHDSKGFFYSRFPEPRKGEAISERLANQKLYYHWVNKPQADDRLIYARPDLPKWIINGAVTENGRYLFIYLEYDISKNDLYYVDLGNPDHPDLGAPVHPLFTLNNAAYTPIGVRGKTAFVQTDYRAPRGRVVAVKLDRLGPRHWRTVVPETDGVLESAQMAAGRVLANRMVVAKSRLSLYSTDGKLIKNLRLPEQMGSVSGISSRDESPNVYYEFTSFLQPAGVYRYDVASGGTSAFFRPKLDFDPAPYQVRQVFYRSSGGTEVPLFIIARKGVKLDGKNPTILYGYGGFDITITPYFNPMLAVWLELGGVYAIPNLRGGGVYGQQWHHAGMLGKKQNVFDDFANAARWLIRHRYTSTPHLGIMGYSNGGLLTGASVTQQPHLFGAVYIGHGVLDMLRFQKFSGGQYWVSEYGTSAKKKDFKWLYAYSPLQNLKPGVCYPPTLITTSTDDDRVVPSHGYQFAAKMQYDQGCVNPILLHVAMTTSHTYMPTDKRIRHLADDWGFIGAHIGMPPGGLGGTR